MSRFVRPETTVLRISHGDTLTVKRRLTAGEQRQANARLYLAQPDGAVRINPLQIGIALVTAYLVDWSLTDDAGVLVPISGRSIDEVSAVLDSLDQESFDEIRRAIEEHERTMTAEREAEQQTPFGGSASSAT